MELLLAAAGAVIAVGGALTVLYKGGRWMLTVARKLGRLADDLLGEPARDDTPARPGLMARIGGIERRLATTEARLGAVEAELRPDGGRSMHDTVNRIAAATGADQTP